MPRRFTLGVCVTRSQQRCDKESDLSIGTAEWKSMIGTVYAELYSAVVETGLRYFETKQTITATGAASYNEPTDHMSTVGVDFVVNAAGERRKLRELMAQERNLFAGKTGEACAFTHVDDQIYLHPKPATGTYEIVYVPQPPDFTSSADATLLDVVTPDGEAFLYWGVAVLALAKEGSDTSLARAERNEAKGRVVNWAILKSLNNARPIQTEGVGDSDYPYDSADWRWR